MAGVNTGVEGTQTVTCELKVSALILRASDERMSVNAVKPNCEFLFHGTPAGLVARFARNQINRAQPKTPINDGLIRLKYSVLKSKAGEGKKNRKKCFQHSLTNNALFSVRYE